MALTERQKIARKGKLTGSRIGQIMGGDDTAMYDLWLELTGDPSFVPPDFDNVWPVQLGNATEQFHLDWIQKSLGPIVKRGESFQHADVDWAAVTLDGWLKDAHCAVEAKHTGGFEGMGIITERYMPQLHWTMYVTGRDQIGFSVIMGAKEPQPVFIKRDDGYMEVLVEQARAFMDCVFNLREPVPNPYIKPPKPEYAGRVKMDGNNEWGAYADLWKNNRPAYQLFQEAAKSLKALVPADAKEAAGYGIVVKRSKVGSLTINLEKDNGQDEG